MKVYIDLILLLNFFYDFIILETINLVLKRNTNIKRIILGSIIGSLTILILFIPFKTSTLFIYKLILSIVIIIITFKYKDIKYTLNNLLYFYLLSFILAGLIYYLKLETNILHNNTYLIYIIILLISPIILLIYKKQTKLIKETNSLYHKVTIYINNNIYNLNGFIDTGNTLTDPITNKLVIITNNKSFINYTSNIPYILVSYNTINTTNLIKCYKIDKAYIENIGIRKDILVGITKERLKYNGIDCILNYKIRKD